MSPIIPAHVASGTTVPGARVLARVLSSTEADLWAPIIPGESPADAMARHAAAADILDDLLAEFAHAAEEVAA